MPLRSLSLSLGFIVRPDAGSCYFLLGCLYRRVVLSAPLLLGRNNHLTRKLYEAERSSSPFSVFFSGTTPRKRTKRKPEKVQDKWKAGNKTRRPALKRGALRGEPLKKQFIFMATVALFFLLLPAPSRRCRPASALTETRGSVTRMENPPKTETRSHGGPCTREDN